MSKNNSFIAFEDISVVVQGPIQDVTAKCLKSIREILPGAEIILSTWAGSDTQNLDFDKLVLSTDPGTYCVDYSSGAVNNINRQLISTQAGLKSVSRSYVIKTRTDISFHNTAFLSFFGKYDDITPKYIKNRILVCNFFTRNPRVFPLPFHLSDWFAFGNTEDIRKLYCIPLQSEKDSLWYQNHVREKAIYTNYLSRFTPEQYIFIYFMKKFEAIQCSCYIDASLSNICLTEKFFAETVVVLNYKKQLGIIFEKYNPNRYFEKYSLLSFENWLSLYNHYINKKYSFDWFLYLIFSYLGGFLAKIRRCVVFILDKIHCKQILKSFLSRCAGMLGKQK